MSKSSITLNQKQIKFLMYMLEIQDPHEAIEKMAKIMIQERAEPSEMPDYINKIMTRSNK